MLIKAAGGMNQVFASVRGGWGRVYESYAGAWQQNVTIDPQPGLLGFSPLFTVITGIASDIAKLRIKLCEITNDVWTEKFSAAFSPVIARPNHYQNRIQFIECWILSRLLWGNVYVLKERDNRNVVVALYILDPNRVTPMVATDGSVYYRLSQNYLAGLVDIEERPPVPASEIIHDRWNCLWHELVGISPIYAAAISATMGNRIQAQSTTFFGQRAVPSGILTAPGEINDETAAELSKRWHESYGGVNAGKVAVLGNDLKFQAVTGLAEQSQLIEQLKWTVEDVARPFHYPLSKLGGPNPPYTKPDEVQTAYYTDCLQIHIEAMELCLDEGLALPDGFGVMVDVDGLLRMDTSALYASNNLAKGWMKLNEQRGRANLGPLTKGGDTVYLQHQDYSIEAIAKRDAMPDPFGAGFGAVGVQLDTPNPPPAPAPPTPPPPAKKELDLEDIEFFDDEVRKELSLT